MKRIGSAMQHMYLMPQPWVSYMQQVQEINQQYQHGLLTYPQRYHKLMEAARKMFVSPTQEGFTCDLEHLPQDVTWMQIHHRTALALISGHSNTGVLCEVARLSTQEGIVFGYAYLEQKRIIEADKIMGESTVKRMFTHPSAETFFYCPSMPSVPTIDLTEALSALEYLRAVSIRNISEVFVSVFAPIPYAAVRMKIHGTKRDFFLPPAWGHIHTTREQFMLFGQIQLAYANALEEEKKGIQTQRPSYSPEDLQIFQTLEVPFP